MKIVPLALQSFFGHPVYVSVHKQQVVYKFIFSSHLAIGSCSISRTARSSRQGYSFILDIFIYTFIHPRYSFIHLFILDIHILHLFILDMFIYTFIHPRYSYIAFIHPRYFHLYILDVFIYTLIHARYFIYTSQMHSFIHPRCIHIFIHLIILDIYLFLVDIHLFIL